MPDKMKHTPGPWKVGSSNEVFPDGEGGESFSEFLTIKGPSGELVCELPGHSQFARDTELSKREDANARLIAAAPRLLSAAANLIKAEEEYNKVDFPSSSRLATFDNAREELKSAIEEAKGEA